MTGGPADDTPRGWERIWAANEDEFWHVPEPAVVEWARGLPAGARVYDLGCGLCRHTRFFAHAGLQAFGGDVSPAGLRTGADRMHREGLSPALACHNMAHLPFADNSFDALLAFHVIYHTDMNGLRANLREIRRVLRAGAPAYITFVGRVAENIARNRADIERGICLEIEPYTFIYTREVVQDKDLPHHYCDEAEVRQLMAGFTVQAIVPVRDDFVDERGVRHIGLHYHVQVH